MSLAADILSIVRPLSVAEFHRLGDTGILDPEERVELLAGVLVQMAAQNPAHASLVKKIARFLQKLELRQAGTVREEKALILGSRDELYPDVCLAAFREDDYARAHPVVTDTFLVIEVSDTSLRTDRRVKLPRYALAQVPEAWIANVPDRQLEVYRDPSGGEYRLVQTFQAAAGGRVAPAAFPELELDVAELFRYV
jgi:Uma2 family endonuclease